MSEGIPEVNSLLDNTRSFWLEIGKNLVRESISTIDQAAKQIIGVAGILEGLYFHALTFSDLRGTVEGIFLLIYIAPIIVLLLSLATAFLVFFPDSYRLNFNSSEASRAVFERTARMKLLMLRLSGLFLVLGILLLGVTVLVYLSGET